MRNAYLFLLVLLATCAGPAAFGQGANIKFEIDGLPDGFCRLIGMVGDQNYLVDTFPAQGGVATFQREKPLDGGLYYFVFPDKRTFVQFLADKDQEFTVKSNRNNLIGALEVEGSLDNELFFGNQKFEQDWKQRYDANALQLKSTPASSPNKAFLETQKETILQERKDHIASFPKEHPESFFTIFKTAGQNPELTYPKKPNGQLDTLMQLVAYRGAYWDNVDLQDTRLLHTPVVANKLNNYISQLTPQVPDSVVKYSDRVVRKTIGNKEMFKYVVNWLAIKYEKPKIMGGEKILVHLVDNFFTDDLAFWYKDTPEELKKIRKKVNDMRPSMLGLTGQDLRCKNINGQYETLYGLNSPVTVLFMYSYTCHHCKERAPVLAQILKEWRAKGVEVYALCLDPEIDKWKAFVEKYDMQDFHNVIDPDFESRYYKKYHVDITPEAYVLDKNHKIIAKDLHPNQLPPVFKKELK